MILNDYIRLFTTMKVKKTNGRLSPHKAIMLLAVIDMIEFELTEGNRFYIDDETESSYHYNWNQYIPENMLLFKPNPWTPYWHLYQEPFWHFFAKQGKEERIDSLVPKGQTASVGKMREVIEYAYLDEELYSLLKDENSRSLLRDKLIAKYISPLSEKVLANIEVNQISSELLTLSHEEIFRKLMDWSMFNAGTTIPAQYHSAILSICDEPLLRGHSKKVSIIFEKNKHDVVLRSVDIKGRKTVCLQFNWSRNSSLANALRTRYSEIYEELLSQKIKRPGEKTILPENLLLSVAFCKSSAANEYLLLPL